MRRKESTMAEDANIAAFFDVLESCGEAAEQVQSGSWDPPVGTYLCLFERLEAGTMDDGTVWAKPHFLIMEEGEFHQKSFTKYPWFLNEGGKAEDGKHSYSLQDFMHFATCLSGGDEVKDISMAKAVVQKACGKALVTLRAGRGNKKGNPFYVYQGVEDPISL